MKNALFLLLAAASFTFASCGGNQEGAADATGADATVSQTEAGIDSTKNKASIPDGNTSPESAGATTAPITSEGTTTAGAAPAGSTTGQ